MGTFNQEHKETKIKNINQGTYFRLKPSDTAPVFLSIFKIDMQI